jgi:hypothetical protein
MSMRDRAVALARNGFRVFLLRENSKLPAVARFYDVASSDPDAVAWMFSEAITNEPRMNNIGVATGDGLVVLDFDVKKGGLDSLALLIKNMGLDMLPPKAVRTPSGGLHFYYKVDSRLVIPNSVSKIAPGVDVRGFHGYVAAPGSAWKGNTYDWVDTASLELAGIDLPCLRMPAPDNLLETELPDLPEAIAQLHVTQPRPKSRKGETLVEMDESGNIARAIAWLKNEAEKAIQGCGGDGATFRVAARLKDFGLSPETAFELLLEHWNDVKAIPPWDYDDLEKKVANAYAYGNNAIGCASALADFEPVELGPSLAAQIWDGAQDPRGTPAEEYLTSSRIDLMDNIAGTVVRYHPQCLWQDRHKPVPALVVALRDIVSGEIASLLRVRLDQRKHWPCADRRILGPSYSVAAMLDQPKGGALTVGVKVEACLAARELGLGPVWALGSVRTVAEFPLVPDVTELRILEEPGSLKAIEVCVTRWRKAGRRVRVAIPEAGADDFIHQLLMR